MTYPEFLDAYVLFRGNDKQFIVEVEEDGITIVKPNFFLIYKAAAVHESPAEPERVSFMLTQVTNAPFNKFSKHHDIRAIKKFPKSETLLIFDALSNKPTV